MRIAFAWGWTGWHVFPVQSLISYIHTHQQPADGASTHQLFWFGESPSLEYVRALALQKTIPELTFLTITSGKYRRENELRAHLQNVIDLVKLTWWFFQSLYYLSSRHIDVVFSKGWYVSLPVVIAAWLLRKPIILHESDTKPGLANRICSRFATTIFTWFAWVFPGKEIVVGQILAEELVDEKFTPPHTDTTHILVTWWSQWAQTMFQPLLDIIANLSIERPVSSYHFHVVIGTKNIDLVSAFRALPHTTVYDFIEQKKMWELLSLCDVAITRWGTTSLAEQQLFNLRKIIIPIPRTHDQKKNALYYRDTHQDIVVFQDTPTYISDFTRAVTEAIGYKKKSYENPAAQIARPKEIIREHIARYI